MVYLKTTFLTQFGLLRRLHHLSRSFFSLIFPFFCLPIRLGSTQLNQSFLFSFFLPKRENYWAYFTFESKVSFIGFLSLMPIFGHFSNKGCQESRWRWSWISLRSKWCTHTTRRGRKKKRTIWFCWVEPNLSLLPQKMALSRKKSRKNAI